MSKTQLDLHGLSVSIKEDRECEGVIIICKSEKQIEVATSGLRTLETIRVFSASIVAATQVADRIMEEDFDEDEGEGDDGVRCLDCEPPLQNERRKDDRHRTHWMLGVIGAVFVALGVCIGKLWK